MTTKTRVKFLFLNSIFGVITIFTLETVFENHAKQLIGDIIHFIGFLAIFSPFIFLFVRKLQKISFKSVKSLGFSSVKRNSLSIELTGLHFVDFCRLNEPSYGFKRKEADKNFLIFTNHLAKGSGGETVIMVVSANLKLPWFILHEKTTANDLIYNALNGYSGRTVKFARPSTFSNTFQLETSKESAVRAYFDDTKIQETFMLFGTDDLYFEGQSNCFLVHRYRILGFEEQKEMIDICKKVFDKLKTKS